jgi:selenocysteine lyase/cysteine desulfurase
MGVAVEYALAVGLDRIWSQIQRTAARLRERLATIDGLAIHDLGAVKGGIVSFAVDELSSRDLRNCLYERGFNLTTSTVFSTRFDMENRALPPLVRASVHYFTTDDECERLATAIEEITAKAFGSTTNQASHRGERQNTGLVVEAGRDVPAV